MRKVLIQKAGSYNRLAITSEPDPQPGPDEVLVEVEAVGVNFADCVVRMGLYESAKKYVGWPITPGFEAAGRVSATGSEIHDLPDGTPVLALTRFGGYATHLTVPRHQVFELPEALTVEQAAGFPTVFLTAYYALFELAHPRPGQTLLVHSAAGGVGGALVQLGKLAGCTVIGVVGSSHKIETARELGADGVIDKSAENLWQAAERLSPEGFEVVLDANGAETLAGSYKHLKAPGKLVVYGFHTMLPRKGGRPNWIKLAWDFLRTPRFSPLALTNDNKSVMAFNLSYLFDQTDLLAESMEKLMGWLKEGKIKPPPTTPYPFDRVADAHRDLESGQTVGKLVLTV